MKIKPLYILGFCGLMASGIAFANSAMMQPLTPSQKEDVAQGQYQKNGGEDARKADNVYHDLDENNQNAIKNDEVQHRENIYDARGHNARESNR